MAWRYPAVDTPALRRDARQPRPRGARYPARGAAGARAWSAPARGLDVYHAVSDAPLRVRRRSSLSLRDEVSLRPWRSHRRTTGRRWTVRLGRARQERSEVPD